VFVSPPIGRWVFVAPNRAPHLVAPTGRCHDIGRKFDGVFSRLMPRFSDVELFGSYRVVSPLRGLASQTARVGNLSGLSPSAALERIGEIAKQQDAEQDVLIATGLSRHEARKRIWQNERDAVPDERDVIELAALWMTPCGCQIKITIGSRIGNSLEPMGTITDSAWQRFGGLVPQSCWQAQVPYAANCDAVARRY
jgi:hypothetical protein